MLASDVMIRGCFSLHFDMLFFMCSTSICKLMRIFLSSSSALVSCFISCLCWLFKSSTEALRSLSWFLSSSSAGGIRGECRSSGEGLRPEEEDGDAGRWLAFGGARTEGLAGSGALPSWAEMMGSPFLRETSTGLEGTGSGSSFPLSLSFLSATAGASRSILDREEGVMICERGRRSVTLGRDAVG